jgi:hypothetical protein
MALDVHQKFCRLCWFGGRCSRFALAGSFKSATNWAGILGVGLLGFVLHQYGHKLMPAEHWYEIAGQGLLYMLAAWVFIFLMRLIASPFMIHREGIWHRNKFIYREPKLAYHCYISPADNNKAHKFRFPDAPPFSFIEYEFRFGGPNTFESMSISLMCTPVQLPKFESHTDFRYKGGGLLVNRRRDLCLTTFMHPNADPVSIRVYIKSWESPAPRGVPPSRVEKEEQGADAILAAQVFG